MGRRLIFVLGACLGVGTGAGAQDCPTADDLPGGIRVYYADGSSETFRPHRAGTIEVHGVIGDGLGYRMELGQGVHLLRYEDVVDGRAVAGTTEVYDYGREPPDLPVPVPGERWQADVGVTGSDGTRREAQSQVYDAAGPLEVGGCTYERVPVLIAYETEDGYMEGIDYLPELGLGYLAWSQTGGEARVTADPVAISVVRK